MQGASACENPMQIAPSVRPWQSPDGGYYPPFQGRSVGFLEFPPRSLAASSRAVHRHVALDQAQQPVKIPSKSHRPFVRSSQKTETLALLQRVGLSELPPLDRLCDQKDHRRARPIGGYPCYQARCFGVLADIWMRFSLPAAPFDALSDDVWHVTVHSRARPPTFGDRMSRLEEMEGTVLWLPGTDERTVPLSCRFHWQMRLVQPYKTVYGT